MVWEERESSGLRGFARRVRIGAWMSGMAYAFLTILGVSSIALPEWLSLDRDLPGLWGAVHLVAVAIFVLLALRELVLMMETVERGAGLSVVTITRFRRFAGLLALSALADLALPIFWQIAVIAREGSGRVSLSLDNSSFLLFLLCLVTFLVSRVLVLGVQYAEDSRSIV